MAASDPKELAAAAKARGNALFAKKTKEGYEEAIRAYAEASQHDPTDHIFHANLSACHLEIAKDAWEPQKKVEAYAAALAAARHCTELCSTWAKGFVRQADAEFELVQAIHNWNERKASDKKWKEESKARRKADPKQDDYEDDENFDKPERELDPEVKPVVDSAGFRSCETSCRRVWELDPNNPATRVRLQALRDAGYATDESQDMAMRDQVAAAPLKAEGNSAFSAKRFKEAAEHYTKALTQDPIDHVFYSNRSACYAEEQEFGKALQDANQCLRLNPQFVKGYSRQALALFHLGRYPESEAAAQAGLSIDSNNTALQEMLKQAQVETAETPEVQKHMHKLREDKRQEQKLQDMLKGLGGGVQVMSPGSFGGLGGMGGGDLGSLFGGGGKARMTEQQMRGMARAMAQGGSSQESHSPAPAPPEPAKPEASGNPQSASSGDAPKSFSPT